MATFGTQVRRGLPRRPGGDPWPAAGDAPESAVVVDALAAAADDPQSSIVERPSSRFARSGTAERDEASAPGAEPPVGLPQTAPSDAATSQSEANEAGGSAGSSSAQGVRRGLPRVPGGEPWPPARIAASSADERAERDERDERDETSPVDSPSSVGLPQIATSDAKTPQSEANEPGGSGGSGGSGASSSARALRRGLPRVAGGEPWPPAGYAPGATTIVVEQAAMDAPPQTTDVVEVAASIPAVDVSTPLPFTQTVWQGEAARAFERERRAGGRVITKPEPQRIGPFTKLQWAGAVVVLGGGLLYAAAMAVLAVRWMLSTGWGVDLLAAYPGEYHLPEGAPVGFPAWLGWQHFFNVFLMVLIIRTGLQVRTEKRPTAFWSPRGKNRRKISLNLWFHQSLDILWIVNGVIFVVLLFVTGQWMRIIPTSWEVFPNAFSAALQYVSLDWPTENGWVNYNSLQQLAYFATVFLAAPLAIATGVRMSGIWPKNATTLNRIYPVEWARAIHFPVMLYFVLFIFVHVVLVFATGALRNLNHMYAAQGSVDPNAYADNWAGFWIFTASIAVIVIAWVAARPLVLAPIARVFGTVSAR